METWGHIVGGIAIVFYFLSYQIFDKKKLLLMQTLATATNCLQYVLLGAYSGFALNIVCILRNLLFYHRDKKYLSGRWLPFALAAVMAGISAFSWDGYHSLFIIVGLMVNTVSLGLFESQNLRKSILVSCPLVLIYNVFEFAIGGIVIESVSILSAIIGILRYRRNHSK